jgi:2-methylcitrate dehydratase
MSHLETTATTTPGPGALLAGIAAYATSGRIDDEAAYGDARRCLMDSLACAFRALRSPDCTRLLGPVVHGATMAGGARVPGTSYELDPVRAAFNLGTMIRWLDANDVGLASSWGHPSDNLGGILSLADYLGRRALAEGRPGPTLRDLLAAMLKAHAVQGAIARGAGLDAAGADRVILVRIATAAVATALLGGTRGQVVDAASGAWLDGGVRPAAGSAPGEDARRGWELGDATSRGVWHALNAVRNAVEVGEDASAAAVYPVTDRRDLSDAPPAIVERFESAVAGAFPAAQAKKIHALFGDALKLDAMPVNEFVAMLVRN